jgi:acyl-homoserine-lactone acylase
MHEPYVQPLRRWLQRCGPPVLAAALAGCAALAPPPAERAVRIERTAHGIAHVSAPDLEALAYGVAYAHTQDNLCQSANHLVTLRGERARFFGPSARGLLGLRELPNELIDAYVRLMMDDARLERQRLSASAATQALARGWVAGYNRYLADTPAARRPKACADAAWVRPMTLADFDRAYELLVTQAGVVALADSMLAAEPPGPGRRPRPQARLGQDITLDEAAAALAEYGFDRPAIGSNGWAFGRAVTADGGGLLLGNPHFPWSGPNRFWQMHLTVPGQFDVAGAAIGFAPVVQIGYNRDVAWTHTVSTGRRFTLHELHLVEGDPLAYRVDGQVRRIEPRRVAFDERAADGSLARRERIAYFSHLGPIVVVGRAGLDWTDKHAYALQDANSGNLRGFDTWLSFARARNVAELAAGADNLGIPWVNTIAADRHGRVAYFDKAVVPDVGAEQLRRCAPSTQAVADLFRAAGLVVLDGSRSDCDWARDAASPVPGRIAPAKLPQLLRDDWVQNSNDSFWLTNPAHRFDAAISPLVGATGSAQRGRTRMGLAEIADRLAGRDGLPGNKIGPEEAKAMLMRASNHAGRTYLPDLLAACDAAPTPAAQQGCAVLKGWDRSSRLDSKGAVLFREFWRRAQQVPGHARLPFDPARPADTPAGLKMDDARVRDGVWKALGDAVELLRRANLPLDAALAQVQIKRTPMFGPVAVPGAPDFEGVLPMIDSPALIERVYEPNYGNSYMQIVAFDARGPLAQTLLTYGQSSDAGALTAYDQLPNYAANRWHRPPFHADEVQARRIGEVLVLKLEAGR